MANINSKNDNTQKQKRPRGRPRKNPLQDATPKEKKPKLTLAEKQALKLKLQKQKEAEKKAKGELEPKNKDRFYCTNKELQEELVKWRDSNLAEEAKREAKGLPIDYTKRIISEKLAKMFMMIGHKLLNHSNFRNYSKELKEDMLSYFYLKIIKGLKNYNFQFNNPFSFVTMAAYNAFLTIIGQNYKHVNIRKMLTEKQLVLMQSYTGMTISNSMNKFIQQYIVGSKEDS